MVDVPKPRRNAAGRIDWDAWWRETSERIRADAEARRSPMYRIQPLAIEPGAGELETEARRLRARAARLRAMAGA